MTRATAATVNFQQNDFTVAALLQKPDFATVNNGEMTVSNSEMTGDDSPRAVKEGEP